MPSTFELHIETDVSHYPRLNLILNVPIVGNPGYWNYRIDESSELFDEAITHFLNLIEKNKHELSELGIKNDDITVWYLYEYEQQCNMEFGPEMLKKMGDLGITFCISCWEKGSTLTLFDEG
jgi:hypothetical protein